jgi:hypothetical protein
MARNTKTKSKDLNEEVLASVFKDIHIHFPGDVYLLAIFAKNTTKIRASLLRR